MAVVGPVAADISSSLEQYAYLSDMIKWGCVVLGAIGAGWAVYARLNDRAKGLV
jgi:hypothetical protein